MRARFLILTFIVICITAVSAQARYLEMMRRQAYMDANPKPVGVRPVYRTPSHVQPEAQTKPQQSQLLQYEGGYSLTAYCHHDPINYVDPWGLTPNGCGGPTTGWVPDNPWWLGGANFESACNRHDLCYEGNGPQKCNASKGGCDAKFLAGMMGACTKKYKWTPWKLPQCYKIAVTYAAVVAIVADNAFDDARNKNLNCRCKKVRP